MSKKEYEIAHNTQEKFDFYVLGLVFTLLALSIQTADLGKYAVADVFELLGWVCLFVAGLSGLWRLEYRPVQRVKQLKLEELEQYLSDLQARETKGDSEVFVKGHNKKQPILQAIAQVTN